jgi:hypothetical protein
MMMLMIAELISPVIGKLRLARGKVERIVFGSNHKLTPT